jgi:ParB-like chromosome segregation protein Spo0J
MTDHEVHPVAALFPMMTADELAELAADITERGLLHEIVLDTEGRVLDGRNRLAACEIAGYEPLFTTYTRDDPAGYALAANIQRRNLTKGQIAMIAGKARLVSSQTTRAAASQAGVSQQRINQASVVLEFAPDLADAVITGAKPLDEAYRIARERKTAAQSEEAQLTRLCGEDADLAERVVHGDLSLPGAWAELAERQRKRAEEQRDARALLTRIIDLTAPPSMSEDFLDVWARQLGDLDPDLISRTEQAGEVLFSLVKRIRQ